MHEHVICFKKLWRGLAVMEIVLVFQPLAAKLLLSHVIKETHLLMLCVGLIRHDEIQKGQAKGVGNSILYVGAKTGRDGIHGATFASEEFSEGEEQQRSAVQVGDPFMEKLLLEACLDLIKNHQDILIGIQDMGAAGLVSSSAEMASKAGSGLILELDKVPQRETQMSPYEMLLSESQERMLICVEKEQNSKFVNCFKRMT